ncbi:MAG: hypothetical protein JNM17_35010 [Archangium sp.]|nr:hypothetical protein [Archangium sp.]
MKAIVLIVVAALALPIVALGAVGLRFTSAKLERMKQVRGFIPADDARKVPVLEKAVIDGANWVRWNDEAGIDRIGGHRFSLPSDAFQRYQPGDQIEVLFFEDERAPIPRESVFAEDGNFVFDRVLLAIELAMVVLPLLVLALVAVFVRRKSSTPQPASR